MRKLSANEWPAHASAAINTNDFFIVMWFTLKKINKEGILSYLRRHYPDQVLGYNLSTVQMSGHPQKAVCHSACKGNQKG
jgi:hypothetical protein